jgi:hypothetical protein
MKHSIIVVALFLLSLNSLALVSGVSAVGEGESRLALENQIEAGKIEPNENRASFQDADIKINRLRYSYGLGDVLGLRYVSLNLEYGQFTSKEERSSGTLFYAADSGNYATLGLSGEILHDIDRVFGFYFNATPSSKYDKQKFSNPRIDTFAFGLTSSFNISENVFYKNLFHYGSGDGTDQNSYFAVDTGFGFRLANLVRFPLVLSSTLFFEADLKDRFDSSYDAAFSAAGRTDRIRAFKYGTLIGLNAEVTDSIGLLFESLQKLGGYDARSTQITKIGLSYKF